MSLRTDAVNHVSHGKVNSPDIKGAKITGVFGENVFTLKTAREYLSDQGYKSMLSSIKTGQKIERSVAAQIANGIKAWAERKGVTHYTHWFQPLTGTTAEKHDAFFKPIGPGKAIERFDGDMLVQQEPDASATEGILRQAGEVKGLVDGAVLRAVLR